MRWLALPCLLGLATPALATTARLAPLDELSRRAELVVVGWAGDKTAVWEGTRIVTHTAVEVEEVWAGQAHDDTLDVVTLGGVVGGIGQAVAGAPSLQPGERFVLLLARDRQGRYHPLDLWQGVFVVAPDGKLTRPSAQATLVGPSHIHLPSSLNGLKAAVLEARLAR